MIRRYFASAATASASPRKSQASKGKGKVSKGAASNSIADPKSINTLRDALFKESNPYKSHQYSQEESKRRHIINVAWTEYCGIKEAERLCKSNDIIAARKEALNSLKRISPNLRLVFEGDGKDREKRPPINRILPAVTPPTILPFSN